MPSTNTPTKTTKASTKTKKVKILTRSEEWRLICDIGLDIESAPELQAILPSLKHERNIEEVQKILKKMSQLGWLTSNKSTKSTSATRPTLITQDGAIRIVDNGATVDYQVGAFSYLADDDCVIVTKKTSCGIQNIAFYEYKSIEEANNMAYSMARKQSKC